MKSTPLLFLLLSLVLVCANPDPCPDLWLDCGNGKCIASFWQCDGVDDCGNMRDEEICDDVCLTFDCSQGCRSSSKGPECYCHPGYTLNTKDNKTCDAPEPLLIYSNLEEIHSISLRSNQHFSIVNATFKATRIASDPEDSKIYWIELSKEGSAIYSSNVNGTDRTFLFNNGLLIPEDIAVDWMAKNLYLTDSGLKQILACKTDGLTCHVLHSTNVDKPRAIVVDPNEGMLYWSDWGENTTGIYRSGMDGSNRNTMVSEDIEWPNDIAIDYSSGRLYWIDGRRPRIEYISLDRSIRKVLEQSEVYHPYSLTVFGDHLFWSEWQTLTLRTCNKFTGEGTKVLLRGNGKHFMGVHVHHYDLSKTYKNPCKESPCSHLCLISPGNSFICACPLGFSLAADGKTCFDEENLPLVLVNDIDRIYHIRPGAVESVALSELPPNYMDPQSRIAFDWEKRLVYVSDTRKPAIYSINMTTMVKTELVTSKIEMPVDISFDWISRNIYWVDSLKGTVEAVSADTFRRSEITANLSKPIAIALQPGLGRMFISTRGEIPLLIMCDMDGKNSKVLNVSMNGITSLAADPIKSVLYFSNFNKIFSLDYSNLNSEPIPVKIVRENITSLAANENYLYWTELANHHSVSFARLGKPYSHKINLPESRNEMISMQVVYAAVPSLTLRSESNNCASVAEWCSHMCLSSPRGRSCACLPGTILSKDNRSCIDEGCRTNEFQCTKDKKCIPESFFCDGVKDCADGTDENCSDTPARCPKQNDFLCQNGRCILQSWRCDGRDDCGDNSDEIDCSSAAEICSNLQYRCDNGECISRIWRCDGENDCADKSDEKHCDKTSCDEEKELRCDHGQCIPKAWACDGSKDCLDGTDERNCTIKMTCISTQFSCDNGTKCIDNNSVCNHKYDCEDKTDEKNCSVSEAACGIGKQLYQCGYSTICIYDHEVCDGFKDCPDGQDESNCIRTADQCTAEEYFCTNNSRCISKRWLCDGDNDCGDAEDETPEKCRKRQETPFKLGNCEEFTCEITGECIPWSMVCNGKNDCTGATDEGGVCANTCITNNDVCTQRCQKTPHGPKCFCYDGYQLASDNVTCEDVNECDTPGMCSQFCNNTKGAFECYCADGYILYPEGKCKATEGPTTLLYLLPTQIKSIDLSSFAVTDYLKDDLADMRGMDYDASDGTIFISDWAKSAIYKYTPITMRQEILFQTPLRPLQLRLDWITKNLYYIEDGFNIRACTVNGTYCTTLVHEDLPVIQSFDLSPTIGLMFWSTWALSLKAPHRGAIERAEMDGSNCRRIVSEGIEWPSAVTVDHVTNMIYWADVKLQVVVCTDFNGLKRRTLLERTFFYPMGMALFEDFVYCSDWATDSLIRCNKFGSGNCIFIHRGNSKSKVLQISHKVQKPRGENRCLNSGCSQLCLLTSESFACKCDDNFHLKNSTCVANFTDNPTSTSASKCPENLCPPNTECAVVDQTFVCRSLSKSSSTSMPIPNKVMDTAKDDRQVKWMFRQSLLKIKLEKIPKSVQSKLRREE